MAQMLQTISVISFAVAGVCLVLAIFFWFFFNIPTVIGDLSGRTARKSIAKMRAANEKNGVKSYKESKTNVARGKLTDNMPHTAEQAVAGGQPETGLLSDNKAETFASEVTGILDEETGMSDEEATGLLVDENPTEPLGTPVQQVVRVGGKKMEMLEEIMLIHTSEVIKYGT